MKALELLYNYLDVAITMDDPTEDIDEAIKELEDLQNRSCNDCKYYLSDNGNFPFPLYPCVKCIRFYADKFERKEAEENIC